MIKIAAQTFKWFDNVSLSFAAPELLHFCETLTTGSNAPSTFSVVFSPANETVSTMDNCAVNNDYAQAL